MYCKVCCLASDDVSHRKFVVKEVFRGSLMKVLKSGCCALEKCYTLHLKISEKCYICLD